MYLSYARFYFHEEEEAKVLGVTDDEDIADVKKKTTHTTTKKFMQVLNTIRHCCPFSKEYVNDNGPRCCSFNNWIILTAKK